MERNSECIKQFFLETFGVNTAPPIPL
jgi:hypothetical protein